MEINKIKVQIIELLKPEFLIHLEKKHNTRFEDFDSTIRYFEFL